MYVNVLQERAKERQLREELEKELTEKDRQLQDVMTHHVEVFYWTI